MRAFALISFLPAGHGAKALATLRPVSGVDAFTSCNEANGRALLLAQITKLCNCQSLSVLLALHPDYVKLR